MSPTTSRGKSGRSYRCYVSAPLQQGVRPVGSNSIQRLSAPEIERVVSEAVQRWVPKAENPFEFVRSIHLSERGLQVSLDTEHCSNLAARLGDGEVILDRACDSITVSLPVLFAPRGSRTLVLRATSRPRQPDPVLIAALRKAHAMLRSERGMPMIDSAPRSRYDRAILRLAFLAPDIQRAILEGRQPTHLNLESLKAIDLPFAWSKQREVLGFASCRTSCSGDQIT